jgi:hypothetical protein
MRPLINTLVALSFLLLPSGCADNADGGSETPADTGETGSLAPAEMGSVAGQGGANAGDSARQGDAHVDGSARPIRAGGSVRTGSPSGASCQPGKAVMGGKIGETVVNEVFAGSNGYALPYDSDDVVFSFGDEGRAYLRPAAGTPDGETVAARGLIQLPGEDARSRTFVCAGEGSTLTLAPFEGSGWAAHLASLSQLGSCPGGTPVAGEVSITLGDGSAPPKIVSTLADASFTVPVTSVGLLGRADRPGLSAEVFIDLRPGVAFVSFGEGASARVDEGGYFVVPDGSPDAGAVYCAGAGSTAVTSGSGETAVIESVTLKNLRRLGSCAAAPASAGSLDVCAQPGAEQGGPRAATGR